MRPLVFCLVAVSSAVVAHVGITTTINQLEQATAKQCVDHDWPKEDEAAHLAWCKHSGYTVHKLMLK